jgi:5-methylcytosine-specific restriction endonuclease McrA
MYYNHAWTNARAEAVRRAKGRCRKCGSSTKLEVNHVIPRIGKGYGPGCHHHQANLETLCHNCHVKVTNQQRYARAEKRAKSIPRV